MNLNSTRLSALLLGLTACASATPVADSGTTPMPSRSQSVGAIRWIGSLQPTQQRTGSVAPTGQNKAFGNVELTSIGPERTRILISVSTPLQSTTSLSWAMHPGRCGSGSTPIAGVERFPVIEVGNNGRAELSNEMALALPESGAFHVNIFWGQGYNLNNVMTCANLKRE